MAHVHDHAHDAAECIEACLACYQACLATAMHHCLEMGGEHTEPRHFRRMMACAEVCRTTAQLMLMGAEDHRVMVAYCADTCRRCADDCEPLEGMEECVAACRDCAHVCQTLA
jgi:hypothetical protein